MFSSPFTIGIASFGEEKANSAFRTFIRFACLVLMVSSSSCVWERLRFVLRGCSSLFVVVIDLDFVFSL